MSSIKRDPVAYVVPGRVLDDGRVLDVAWLTFGRARLTISADVDTLFVDDGW